MTAEAVELDATAAAWYQAIVTADAEIERLKAIRERAAEHLQTAMGDAAEARIGGRPVITWAWSRPSMRLDRKALEATYGADVIALFLTESRPARPFRILAAGDD